MVTTFSSFSTKNTFFCSASLLVLRARKQQYYLNILPVKLQLHVPLSFGITYKIIIFRICFTIQNVHIELLTFRLKFVFFLNFGLLSRNAINFCSPPPFGISIDILNKRRVVVFFFTMGPWYSGTQCGMLIPRPKFKSQRVMFTLDKWTIAYWWPPPRLAIRYWEGLHQHIYISSIVIYT